MTVLILNRSPLKRRPYQEWLHDYPDGIVLLASRRSLERNGDSLPAGNPYLHAEAIENFEEGAEIRERALALAKEYDIRCVIAMHERDLEVAGALRDELGVPGQSFASASAYRDKLVMKRHAMADGIPVAPHAAVGSPEVLREFARDQGYPVVVKPRDGSGSIGVRILRDAAALDEFVADESQWRQTTGTVGMLAEGFVHGRMYHVDGMVLDGRVAAAWPFVYQYRPGGIERTEGPRLDVALDRHDPLTPRMLGFAERVITGFPTPPHTTFHAEMFLTRDDEVVLCEIASRNGGGLINVMLKAMFGVHFPSAWVRASAGLPVPVPRDGTRMTPACLAGEARLLKRPGTVRVFPSGPPFPWVEQYETYVEPGQMSAGASASADLMAAMVVSAPAQADCENRLRRLTDWFLAGLEFDPADTPLKIPL